MLKVALILLPLAFIAVFGTKCQQSLQYKKYKLDESALTIKDTKTNIKHQGVCAALAVQGNYPTFIHKPDEEKCELATVDMLNIVDDEENGVELYLDLEFREPTREILELFAPLTTKPYEHHIINYEDDELYPSPLMEAIPERHSRESDPNFLFKGKFYNCHLNSIMGCQVYDVNNGTITDYSAKQRTIGKWIGYGVVVMKDKVWIVGGRNTNPAIDIVTNKTEFMDEDSNWTEGPEMPEPRYYSTLVAISDTEVLVFGGMPEGVPSYLYDDSDGSLVAKAPIGPDVHRFTPATFMTLPGLGQVVFVIQPNGKAVTYDFDTDSWIMRPTLDMPHTDIIHTRLGFLSPKQRFYVFGGIRHPNNALIDSVYELIDGTTWKELCPIKNRRNGGRLWVTRIIDPK